MIDDEFYMSLALKEAWRYQILTYPNPAVGCVILDKNGSILSIKAHKKAGFLHAEPLAILFALFKIKDEILYDFLKEYNLKFNTSFSNIKELDEADINAGFGYDFILSHHQNLLKDAKAYVTLEPCSHTGKTPPCANLFKFLNFKEVIIAHEDLNKIASGGASILKNAGIRVKTGVLNKEANELLEPFLSWQSSNFRFFKLATTLNGVISDGIISNEQSRTHSHQIRSVIDLLVIGGSTVRTDRPTLDTRLAKNPKNPDVLIYSTQNEFDTSIPLFSVKNREVFISNIPYKDGKRLSMYEGGYGLLDLVLKGEIENLNWILIYQSDEFRDFKGVRINAKLKHLFSEKIGENNRYGWYKI